MLSDVIVSVHVKNDLSGSVQVDIITVIPIIA